MMTSVTQLPLKNCDGGHICSPPKECCKQGCCYPPVPPVSYRTPTLPTTGMLNPIFLGHWYFWAAVTATVAGILCACSLWRKHSQRSSCCGNSGRDDRASEPDSNGSCYAPPHYSRCNSFHQAPPPYSEVTSKPDLYPLVISYNGYNLESSHKVARCSTGYLMVQYFRNYIVRPVGTLSTTSTMDSLGSSFLCNAANTIIPPPYSCTGSLEEVNSSPNTNNSNPTHSSTEFPRSVSSATCNDFHLAQHSPGACSQSGNVVLSQVSVVNGNLAKTALSNGKHTSNGDSLTCSNEGNREVSITTNPCYMKSTHLPNVEDVARSSKLNNGDNCSGRTPLQADCDLSSTSSPPRKFITRKLNRDTLAHDYHNILDSVESQDDEHNNFSDLLNLSVCIPGTLSQLPLGGVSTCNSHSQDSHNYSVVNSITSSDISSLANLGTPDSPPRATSPTGEIRELLDKIQQLPQQKSPVPVTSAVTEQAGTSTDEPKPKGCSYSRSKAKTMYMPLNTEPAIHSAGRVIGAFGKQAKGWLSRSAPNTPCGSIVPNFPISKKQGSSQKGSRGKITDASPLLNEAEESEEENGAGVCRSQYS